MTGVIETRVVPFLDLAPVTREVRSDVMARWARILDTGTFVGGPDVESFERAFARYCGSAEAVGVGNGTDALHLTLRALEIGPGDEVVVPANTFVATVEAILLAGARPRFADVDPDTLLLTPESVDRVATAECRAVVPVHLYGQVPDMDGILAVAASRGLLVVEDAAQAQGATWRGRRAGSLGIAGCFSFYPGKNLGAFGDAGAVTTSDVGVAARLRSLRDHGRGSGGHYSHDRLGTNSRLDALQAAVLEVKLGRLDVWNESRRVLVDRYREALPESVGRLVVEHPEASSSNHLAVLRVVDRDRCRDELASRGIATGIHYPTPCHVMVPYAAYADGPLPVVEANASRILSLPLHPHMDVSDVDRVCDVLTSLVGGSA
ncbi:MAG: DegT/DnrJ/EryC1/StrS family aminotransferase [Nocardioidaceae bacterium]